MYKRNQYEYFMLVCRTYLSPHSPQAKTNKLNKSCKVVGEKSICYWKFGIWKLNRIENKKELKIKLHYALAR